MTPGEQSTLLHQMEVQLLERTREIERRRQVEEGLRGILTVLNSDRSLAEILETIVSEARRLLGADAAAIYRLMPGEILSIQSEQGLSAAYTNVLADIPVGQLATGRAVESRQPVPLTKAAHLLGDVQPGSPHFDMVHQLASQFQSVLSVPLLTKDQPVGALTLYYTNQHDFTQEDIDLAVTFCGHSTLAIENAHLREKARQEAITAERSRLARDLHDSVTQMLFSANLITEVLPAVWERDQDEGQRALGELRQLTRGALAEMRAMLLELRPDGLENARLEELLRQLVEAIAGRMRIPVSLKITGQIDLPGPARLALYRIAQEALNNIAKHSGATHVEVTLAGNRCGGELRIRDNGCGFNPQHVPADHLGLSIMRERATAAGAEISVDSRPGLGTEIAVIWQNSEQKDEHNGA